MIGKERA
nr:hypothetical protein [Tanacetum cinerariifolium]